MSLTMRMRLLNLKAAATFLIIVAAAGTLRAAPTEYTLRSPKEWTLQSGRVLTIDYDRQKVTRLRDQNSVFFEISYPEVITQVVASEGARSLLILVSRMVEPRGYNYSFLLTVQETRGAGIKVEKRLPAGIAPMMGRRWVVELGAVSDDARLGLIKLGEADQAQPPFKVGRVWETWDLVAPRLVSTGLKLCQ